MILVKNIVFPTINRVLKAWTLRLFLQKYLLGM